MTLNFYVGFRSLHGQSLVVKIIAPSKNDVAQQIELPLQYLNESYWHLAVKASELGIGDELTYSYIFRDSNNGEVKEFCKNSRVALKKIKQKKIDIIDEWKDEAAFENVFSSKPFATVFNKIKEKVKVADTKSPTHIFSVQADNLASGKAICLAGTGKKLGDWDTEKPLLLELKNGQWHLRLNLAKEKFPLEYKLGVYDLRLHKMDFEAGENRVLPVPSEKESLSFLNHTIDTSKVRWRAAGVNIQLSSLKTAKSWGVGEFTDLNLFTDFTKAAGMRLIQLLPINDTTATHTNKDSYPYSAVSAFALHPIYLNVQKLATALGVQFSKEMLAEVALLNAKSSLQYEEVTALKKEAVEQLYNKDKASFKDDFDWFAFFDLNRHWLVPYAAYCYLRDKNQTADYNTWAQYASFDEDAIQELVSPENDFYDEIAIHYYTQYHLHLQLKSAVDYAHKAGLVLKGDLPIGVGRYSADAWMYRSLFHMDMQAGAPPDAFATKGQNWSFPTYNWQKMAEDDYAWWRQRMEHMSNYFDAIRIDHVLGFFRIWAIPVQSIQGIMGKFVPAWPLHHDEFGSVGVPFSEDRFCEPYITDQILHDLFGEHSNFVREHFLQDNRFKESLNTQQKVAAFFAKHEEQKHLQPALFHLLSNIIAIRDEELPYNYHLRIGMHGTESYKALPYHEQQGLNRLYDEYFFNKQNSLWEKEGIEKLDALRRSTDMLICAEDLGMVPKMVEGVLANMQMLALEVQRMPKKENEKFSNPQKAPYPSVVTPSTHDMPAIREWWEEDRKTSQEFFNQQLGQHGNAPYYAEPWLCREIVQQHLNSPAMWAVFLIQDLLCMDDSLRIEDPKAERINNPANPDHYWNYRMHLPLEALLTTPGFILAIKTMVQDSGR